MSARLRWGPNRFTVDGRFAIQTERVRDEGTVYTLMVHPQDRTRALNLLGIELAFYGRGGIGQCKAAAQTIADEFPSWDRSRANAVWV